MVSWALVLFLVFLAGPSTWSALRSTKLSFSFALNMIFTAIVILLIANAATMPWHETIPIWLWWLIAALFSISVGVSAFRFMINRRNH